jgi:hypothetical protein
MNITIEGKNMPKQFVAVNILFVETISKSSKKGFDLS